MDEKTGAVLEIERNVDIHNEVMALLFSSFPPPLFSLYFRNIQGNNISFSMPIFKCSMSQTQFEVFNANQLSEHIVQVRMLLRKRTKNLTNFGIFIPGHIIVYSAFWYYCFGECRHAWSTKPWDSGAPGAAQGSVAMRAPPRGPITRYACCCSGST